MIFYNEMHATRTIFIRWFWFLNSRMYSRRRSHRKWPRPDRKWMTRRPGQRVPEMAGRRASRIVWRYWCCVWAVSSPRRQVSLSASTTRVLTSQSYFRRRSLWVRLPDVVGYVTGNQLEIASKRGWKNASIIAPTSKKCWSAPDKVRGKTLIVFNLNRHDL